MVEESDDDIEDEPQSQKKEEEEEPEIVESEVELDEDDVVEPDDELPQKVYASHSLYTCFLYYSQSACFRSINCWGMGFVDGRPLY